MDAAGKMSGDEVVISGISGLYPNSENVVQFMDNLYNKVDMVTTQFTEVDHPEVPKHYGKVSGTGKFDAQFFRVPYNQAISFDAMARKLLEQTYCAIFDAGINPLEFKGTKIGVYSGSSYQDYSSTTLYEYGSAFQNDFIVSGSCKSMFSNRVSFWCDGKGPSYSIDSSDTSFTEALEKAYNDMKSGVVDAAIVSGCSLCLLPKVCLNIKRTGVLCLDGKTKCFDKNGDGYVRSEAIGVLFLQRAKHARRIYAEVSHVKTTFGTDPENNFLPQRKPEEIEKFLTEFYSEANVNPSKVEYVEGHGTGLAAADANELQAIGDVFGRQKPVMVGCVKSNMGNSEPAAGICAVTKLCLAYEKGLLPANLHCNDPLGNNTVQVLTEHAPFERGYTAINNFSGCGVNGHILLKGFCKPKMYDRYKSSIPSLVCVSGRQETSVDKIFNILKNQKLDPEVIGLLHNIHNIDTPGHTCRGYAILDKDEEGQTVSLAEGIELYQGAKRPLWFVYSGMGSQWAGMGAELMKIPIFAAAIEKCHKTLEPKGIDLIRIITDPDKKVFDNILNCFVGITAVQIGLTDMLKAMNIVPNNVIGHSVGEIGCAYCDGGLSAEDTILASYTRGLVSIESEFIKGSMAAVGLGFKQLEPLCPPEIDIACHNSFESSTISGPVDVIKEFVKELAGKNIFVKEVPCGNIAYHSRYVQKAANAFQKGLQEVIKTPVKRSEKWICSSLPEERWNDPLALYSSAEYHANNFTSPVYFEESARHIPKDAILVEVAPHGLLQAILKRSHPNCCHLPLTRRGNSNPIKLLLEAFGKLYQEGFNPKINSLYPKIDFPVSTGTLPISHYVEWHHEEDWPVILYGIRSKVFRPCRQITLSLEDSEHHFIGGHVREGNIVFPEAAILVTLWETLAMYNGKNYEDMSVSFRDVHFAGEIILHSKKPSTVNFDIGKGNGYFEVSVGAAIIVKGYIAEIKPQSYEEINIDNCDEIDSDDIYSLLNTKGYCYTDAFRSIVSTNIQMNNAKVKWSKNWSTLIDSLIQLHILGRNHNGVSVPKIIKYLDISTFVDAEQQRINLGTNEGVLNACIQNFGGATRCAGIEMRELIFEDKPTRSKYPQVLQRGSFMPYIADVPQTIEDALLLILQIVVENIQEEVIKILDHTVGTKSNISSTIDKISDSIPSVKFDVIETDNETNKVHLVIVPNVGHNKLKLKEVLLKDEFVLSLDNSKEDLKNKEFQVIFTRDVGDTTIALLRKQVNENNIIPIICDTQFNWFTRVRGELTKPNVGRVVLVSEEKPHCGLRGIIKILKKEFGNKISYVGVDDLYSPRFNFGDEFFKNQLKKNLFVNILKDGQWGGFYYLPCPKTRNVIGNFTLVSDNLGQLDNLYWVESSIDSQIGNLVQVYCAGISIRDVERAAGMGDTDCNKFGMDFSGVDKKGQRVMGVVRSGALASLVEPDPHLIWPVPHHWTLEEAATVPLPYIHAYYCLFIQPNNRPGRVIKTIFVTGGAGAFGQAVISISLSLGWTVFTSVGDISKKHYLMKRFPQLKDKHIASSYEADFFNVISEETNTEMCDLVINTYTGELREYAMKCVRRLSVLLDVSHYDMRENNPIGMYFLTKERSYLGANLSTIFDTASDKERKILQKLLFDGIINGVVKPISHVVFDNDEVVKAFRLLSSDKRKGRFLIRIRDASAPAKGLKLIPRISCSSKGVFVIVCDNSNLGIELADRLVKQGARHLVFHLKQENDIVRYLHKKIAVWRPLGVKVDIKSDDLQVETNCVSLLKYGNSDYKVHGVYYIKPQAKRHADEEGFIKYGNEITNVATYLDIVSRNNCPELKHFAIIARFSNNVIDEYSTSVLENISQTRADNGLPALLFCPEIQDQVAVGTNIIDLQVIETMLNSLESCLRQNFVNVHTHNISKNKTFKNRVSQIFGFNINSINENMTVGDLISSKAILEELKVLLKDVISIEYTIDAVKDLTISSLKTLNIVTSKKNTGFDDGLQAFFKFVDEEEISTSDILKPMPTLVDKLIESEYELDSNGMYLMLIPGFEGHPNVFDPICKRLKVRAVTCQLGPDMINNSIPDMAFGIKKFLSKRFNMKSPFHILGYSFGVNLALEVAALLEKDGLTGQVYCLDSSPDVLRDQMNAYIGKLSDNELQNAIIEHLYFIMRGQKDATFEKELKSKSSWSEKVDLCVLNLRKHVSLSTDYQRGILESAYRRMVLARNYNPSIKLESEIVLIKGIPHPKATTLPSDYNLSKYTKKPVKVFDISSDFASAPEDCKVSDMLNHLLDPQLLEGLRTMNLCEAYLTKPSTGM